MDHPWAQYGPHESRPTSYKRSLEQECFAIPAHRLRCVKSSACYACRHCSDPPRFSSEVSFALLGESERSPVPNSSLG
jgi:hypothetical protein